MIYGAISIETAFAGVYRDWHAVEHSMLKEENNPCQYHGSSLQQLAGYINPSEQLLLH